MINESPEKFSMQNSRNHTNREREFTSSLEKYFNHSLGTNVDKLRNFTKYVPRQTLSLFLAKHELFQRVVGIHGNIIECGVFLGGGLMTWAQLSSIYEPVNYIRRIIGFDTFTGFPDIGDKDRGDNLDYKIKGGLATHAYDDLQECVRLYDLNRNIGHISKVELVVGDAVKTIPDYLQKNTHLVVSMLYLDFDLYEPTKLAIETFLPRMPKGAVLVFDELNQPQWPGETQAVLDSIGLKNLRIQRFSFTPQISFAVLE